MIYNAHDDNKTITFASSMQIKAGGHPLRHLATKKTTTQALATSSHRNGTISPSRDLSVAEGGGGRYVDETEFGVGKEFVVLIVRKFSLKRKHLSTSANGNRAHWTGGPGRAWRMPRHGNSND